MDLNIIYNYIDKMPNLNDFLLINDASNNIDLELLKKFLRKLLLMKFIKRIYINLDINNNEKYSKKELKKIYTDINFDKFYKINIYKFKIREIDALSLIN